MTSRWIFWIRPKGCARLNGEKYETKLKQIKKFFPKSLDPAVFTVHWYDKEQPREENKNVMATFICQPLNGETEVSQFWSIYKNPAMVPLGDTEFELDTTKCARAFVEFSLQIQEMIVSAFSHTFGLFLDDMLSSQPFYISAARILSKAPPLKIEHDDTHDKGGPASNNGENSWSPDWTDAEIHSILNLMETEKLDIKNLAGKTNYLSGMMMQKSKFDRSPQNIKQKIKKLRKRYRKELTTGRPSTWIFFLRLDRLMKMSTTNDEDEDEDKDAESDTNEPKHDQNDREAARRRERLNGRDRRRRTSPSAGVWSYEETRWLLGIMEDSGYDLLNVTSSQYEIMSRVLQRRYRLERNAQSIKNEVDKILSIYRREVKGSNSRWRSFPMVDRLIRKSHDFGIFAKSLGIHDNDDDIPPLKINFETTTRTNAIPSLMDTPINPIPQLIINHPTTPIHILPAIGAVGSPVHTAKRELLRVEGPVPIAWISATGGNYPDNHVESDRHGCVVTLVARAEFEGVELPAQLQTDGGGRGACYIYWGTMIQEVYSYEVLVGPPGVFGWVPSGKGEFVGDAIIGGRSRTGEALFIGRCCDKVGRNIPGIILPSRGMCYILIDGKQIGVPEYEILVVVS